jgi:penicillin-binding protein 2
MEGAVLYGTAPKAQVEGVRVAGKTGTAQYCDDIAIDLGICGEGLQMPEHAWFAAFAPVDDPQISVIVFVYGGGEGTVAAVPVAHDILMYHFGLYEDPEGASGEGLEAEGADQAPDTDAGTP